MPKHACDKQGEVTEVTHNGVTTKIYHCSVCGHISGSEKVG